MVGERGITLSGGQKQRTAIARAVLRDPRILILDDALASVDTATEERILTELSGVMRGRTTILISHRVSTIRHADRIFVLEHGERGGRGVARRTAGARRVLRGSVSEAVARRGAGGDLESYQAVGCAVLAAWASRTRGEVYQRGSGVHRNSDAQGLDDFFCWRPCRRGRRSL